MSSTVKIDDRRKESLERFVASLLLEKGVRITLQEALGLMVDYSIEKKDAIVKKLKKLPPLEEDPACKIWTRPDDWKVKDASEKIDEYLYGSGQ